MYENINLSEWPFRVSADENFASVWAGRPKTKAQIERLIKKINIIPKTGLHIFWANFGMGKTHTLFHMKFLAQQSKAKIIPIYVVMPKRSTGFIELYREIVQAFLSSETREYLCSQLVDLGQTSRGSSIALHPMFSKSPGVVKALLAIRGGEIEATTNAMQWLSGQPGLPSRALSSIGVTYRIKTPEDAIHALNALINLACFGVNENKQLLLMIDEYQRIGELRSILMSQINSSIHTVFNSHPIGLQLVLTFSFGNKENVEYHLSEELKSRADLQLIHLDYFSKEEAKTFIYELLSKFRISDSEEVNSFFPFSNNAVDTLLDSILKKKKLTPRRIMQYADHILSNFVIEFDENSIIINSKYVEYILRSNELGSLDNDFDD